MKAISVFIGSLALILQISFLLSYPMYLLWNGCLVDAVTVLNPVTLMQMWGIGVLISLLFKSSSK